MKGLTLMHIVKKITTPAICVFAVFLIVGGAGYASAANPGEPLGEGITKVTVMTMDPGVPPPFSMMKVLPCI